MDSFKGFCSRFFKTRKQGGAELKDMPELVLKEIFAGFASKELMKLRSVSKSLNAYILQCQLVELKLNKDNYDFITNIDALKISLDIRGFEEEFTVDELKKAFFLKVKKLTIGRIKPVHLYNLLSLTQNLSTLIVQDSISQTPRPSITLAEYDWTPDFQFDDNGKPEWLQQLRTIKLASDPSSVRTKFLMAVKNLLEPCQISKVHIEDQFLTTNEIFSLPAYDYADGFQLSNMESFPVFIRAFLDQHKESVNELFITKPNGVMKMKLGYDPEGTESRKLKIREISTEKVNPLRGDKDPTNFVGLLSLISKQTLISTLKIGKYETNVFHLDYQSQLHLNIFPNIANTITKLDLYTPVNAPEIQKLIWRGSMFTQMNGLKSLSLGSNSTPIEHCGMLNEIHLLPPTLLELKTTLCIELPFSMTPTPDPETLQDIFPCLEILNLQRSPWFRLNGTFVTSIDPHLVSFMSSFKTLKNYQMGLGLENGI